jgi:ATP-dependent Zn protease
MTFTMYESEQQRSDTAYHEAGHALVGRNFHLQIERITIDPTPERLGGFTAEAERPDGETDYALAATYLAGWCAERRHNPDANNRGSREDFDKAQKLLDRFNATRSDKLSVERILADTDDLVAHYWNEVGAVASALLEENTLSGKDITKICEKAKLPQPPARDF